METYTSRLSVMSLIEGSLYIKAMSMQPNDLIKFRKYEIQHRMGLLFRRT